MQIILVRHGEPGASPDAPEDPPLSELGRVQAAAVGDWLRHEAITAVYSSPSRRARQTADPLARMLDVAPVVVEGLAEFVHAHEYRRVEDLRRASDPLWAKMATGDLSPFGTDAPTFRSTVFDAVEAIAAAHPGENVAVFSHAGTINAYLGEMLDIERLLWAELAYCSVTRVAISRNGVRSVLAVNEQAHARGFRPG